MANQKISDQGAAAPLLLTDHVIVARGATPPNLKATIAQVLALGGGVGGSGAIDRIPIFTSPNVLGNSRLGQSAGAVNVLSGAFVVDVGNMGVGIAAPLARVHVNMQAPADLDTFAGAVFLQAFGSSGSGNFGAGIIFGQVNGGVVANRGASITTYQPTGSSSTSGLAFNVHGTGSGDPRFTAMEINHLGDVEVVSGGLLVTGGNVEIGLGNLGVGVIPLTDVHVSMKAPATPTTLAGSLFLEAFNNPGAGNFGAGIIFGSAGGGALPNGGASIVVYQDAADLDTAGLIFYTHGEVVGARTEAMRLDSAQNMGVGGIAPTIKLDVNEKSGNTDIGGDAIKLTNKTGGNTVAGQLVIASTGTADAFETAGISDDRVIGVVLDAGVADGSEAWIMKSGIANVLIDAGGTALGDRIISSTTAGSGLVDNGPASPQHFQEIGHCIEAIGGAGLARCVIHLN